MSQKACIFCDGTGLSKEHFWPDWISKHISKYDTDKHVAEVYSSEAKSKPELEKKAERQGNLVTKKFRVVCKSCNNGWMSELEKSVKPFILSLIQNKYISLNPEQVAMLSRWVVMKVLVAEQNHDGTQVMPAEDRKRFFESNIIPSYFRVYMARHDTDSESAYLRHSNTLALSKSGPLTDMKGMERNTQSVSFLVGPLFFYVIACREENYNLCSHIKLNQLKCIHPFTKNSLSTKALKTIPQPRIAAISHALEDLGNSPQVKYGGPSPSK